MVLTVPQRPCEGWVRVLKFKLSSGGTRMKSQLVKALPRARFAAVGVAVLGLAASCTSHHYHGNAGPKNTANSGTTKTKVASNTAKPGMGTPNFSDAPCGAYGLGEDKSVHHFAATRHYTWEPGITLNAQFLDGSPDKWAKVQRYANTWTKYANINLKFHRPQDAPPRGPTLRISFQRNGYWSIIGSQAAYRAKTMPTMNFNHNLFRKGEREIKRVVLHEFGHALGLFHEHQNPKIRFTWNKPLMYAYYRRTHGWNQRKVDSNIFRRLTSSTAKSSEFDPKSIMLYSFPAQFTAERVRMRANWELSATDKREISKLYPGRWRPSTGGVVRPNPRVDHNRLSRSIRFTASIKSKTAKFSNYSVHMVAPPHVLREIDHVLYQRQHRTFREFKSNQFYRVTTRSNNFELAWQGYSWHPVKAKVIYRNGQQSVHFHRNGPTRIERGPNWDAIARSVKFKFTKKPDSGKWSIYRIELDAAKAVPHIHWIEYQRQHKTFAEYPQNRYLRRDAKANNFAIFWRGYSSAPLGIRVRFKNGMVRSYRVNRQPIGTYRIATNRFRSPNGYSIILPRGWTAKKPGKERWYRPGAAGFKDNIATLKSGRMVMSAANVRKFRGALMNTYRKRFPDFQMAYYGKRMFGSNEAIYLIGSLTMSGYRVGLVQAMIASFDKTVIVTCIMQESRYVSIAQTCERSFATVRFGR